MKVTTLLSAADDFCPNKWDCPSVHDVDTDPTRRYVVSKLVTACERSAFAHLLGPGEVVGWMPPGFLPDRNALLDRTRHLHGPGVRADRQYVITELVTDGATLREFGDLISRDEQLGVTAVRDLAVI